MNIEHVARIADLNARYVDAIDADRLETWPDFFLDDGRYRITTAENVAQGLPLSIIYTTSRAMMRDRITALREANVYEGQHYRHVVGMPLIVEYAKAAPEDLFLRPGRVLHVPFVVNHRLGPDPKATLSATQRQVGEAAIVETGPLPGTRRVRWKLPAGRRQLQYRCT